MLKKCEKVLLLSDVESFADTYTEIAQDVGVELSVSDKWSKLYRLNAEAVILGSKYLDMLNPSYYPKAVLILKEGENPGQYMQMGITRFIFDYRNRYELSLALYRAETVTLHTSSRDIEETIKASGVAEFCFGDYDFRFDRNHFRYKGVPIYLCDSQKAYLAEWLLNAHKDNRKRMVLCNLRKKFGSEFLSNVDRFGQIRRK